MTELQKSDYLERKMVFKKANLNQPKIPALFLDRDGVIIEDKHYLSDVNNVKLCRGVSDLLRYVCLSGWHIVVITNQSGISRKYFTWEDYEKVTHRIIELLGSTPLLSAIYANGHSVDGSPDSWRKPNPNMIFEAAKELRIDLPKSIMIGDRLSDIKCGTSARVGKVCHVLSGHGKKERSLVEKYKKDFENHLNIQNRKTEFMFLDSLLDFPLELIENLIS